MNRYIVISLVVVLLALTSCSMVAEHEWSPWSVIKEATCEETGLRKATCLICDAEKEETIPKHAHTLNAHNKCSECGKYQIAEDYGEGDTLSRKLQIAISDISSEGAIVALHEGTYNFGEIGAQTISEKGVTVEGVRGKNNENTAVFTLPSGTEEAIKATGEDFSLRNVTINVTGSSSAALTLTGNNAVITNTDINLADSSKNTKAIGDITDGQSVTLDGVNINGGGITSSGDLVVKNSTIETSSGRDALAIKGGTVSLTGSTLEGNVKSEKTIESITITDSSINTGNNGGTNTLKGKTVTIDSSNLGGSSDITATGDAIISGSNLNGGGITKITASTVSLDSTTVGGSVTVEATKKTSVTGSSINEGEESGKLALISPVISIAGTKLAGDISLDAGSSSTANKITIEESSVNDSGSGKLTVTGGTLSVDKSSLAGDITIEKSVSGAKITSSTIDTSAGSNALKTGTDITIEGSTVTKGSGLYVIPTTGTTVKVSISSSTSDTGEEITNQTMRNIVSKELSDDEVNKGDVVYPWSSGGSCSVDDAVVPESLFFTLKNNDGTTYTFQADKGVEITLSSYVQSRGSSYVGPTFYSDSDYTKEIKKIKLTGDNRYIITDPSSDTAEHSGNIATKWEYKVSFNLDGGTGSTATATTTNNGKLTITNPTKDNCTFAGWYDASDSEKKIVSTAVEGSDSTTSVTLTKPITLKAKWSATVTYNTSGGTEVANETVVCGEKITTLPEVTKDNYIFGGWYKDAKLTQQFDKDRDVITENTTLYAKWKVELVVNGVSKGYYDENSVINIADLSRPSREGCEFEGWYTDSALLNRVTGETITLVAKTTLYPKYVCSIELNGNGGTFSDGTSSSTKVIKVDYNGKIQESDLTVTRTVSGEGGSSASLEFGGWYSTSGFESGTEVTKDTIITKGMTLYARWQVAYSVDGVSEYADEGSMLELAVLAEKRVDGKPWIIKDNVKWYRGSVSDDNLQDSDVVISSDMNNLALVSEVVCYIPILDYDSEKPSDIESYNYNKNESSPAVTVDISSGKLTLPQPTSDKYDFDGWYTCGGTGEEQKVDDTTRVADNQTRLVAKWSIKKFTITFEANGGTSSLSSKTVEYGDGISETDLKAITIKKDNYNFDGWYENSNKVTSLSNITANHTLTAKWIFKIKINGTEYSSENAVITFESCSTGTLTLYKAKFGSSEVSTNTVETGQQFGGWTINNKEVTITNYPCDYDITKIVTSGGSISISGSVSTKKVTVTVQNREYGKVNTVGTYDVDYGTTVKALIEGKGLASNVRYIVGNDGTTLYSSESDGYKFTQNTTLQQVCYVTIWENDGKGNAAKGWIYCGDELTKEAFNKNKIEGFDINEEKINKLKYDYQQYGHSYGDLYTAVGNSRILTCDVTFIIGSGT